MITAIHALIYSDDPPKTRAFLRDVLGWPCIEHADSEPGWLIFRSGPSEMGVHPTRGSWEGHEYSHPLHHSVSLVCDDIETTVADLRAKGAEFEGEIQDMGFGIGVTLLLPAAGGMLLYEPKHELAYKLP